ncbi:MAG TPA: GMC family oxidoreductase N-terminal domain-containing protein [Hyphomicrobiales bacterium]|nr:GMC family oxidoreductase N-terminal domain-containing protein [Hyphomicrobiales bacterium]
MTDVLEADYVVVGAGSAGCVVAARLSEDAGTRVLLLEAGPPDRNPFIHIPAGTRRLIEKSLLNWNYATEPDPGIGGRSLAWPRGKVLGGSSSINGMNYVRGNPADYDGWVQMGCRGWSYAEVLPFFRKAERYAPGDPVFRGKDGPLVVQDYPGVLPVTHRFVAAAEQAGFACHDYNGRTQEGVGYSQMTRIGRWRGSTAATYLAAAKRRPNLATTTAALATGLAFDGARCTGVRLRRNGRELVARARREVILSGGTINSPQLLQISGIGDPVHLAGIGVPVRHASPGVGRNLADHYAARLAFRIRGLETINELSRGWRLVREIGAWVVAGRGALTNGVSTASVFCRSRPGLASPDLQLLFAPFSWGQGGPGAFERAPGVTISVCATRPDSRGTVLARSPDPAAKPAIVPNYLSAPGDLAVILAGIRTARGILAQPALAAYVVGETAPGGAVTDDAALADFTRRTGGTVYHPVGTCRMGEDDAAVVDSRLRVRGLQGLRVVDASVMPTLTTGNTNAPTIMIAEKGAAMIREDAQAA